MSDLDERRHRFDDVRFWRHARLPGLLAFLIAFGPQCFAEHLLPDQWDLWAQPPSEAEKAEYAAWMKTNGVGWRQRQIEEHLAGIRPASELRIGEPLRSRVMEIREDTDPPEEMAESARAMFRNWDKVPVDLRKQGVTECRPSPQNPKVGISTDCYPIKEAAVLGDPQRLARLLRSDADAVGHDLPRLPSDLALAEQWPHPTIRQAWPSRWKTRQYFFGAFLFGALFNLSVHAARRRSLARREVKDAKGAVVETHPAPTESDEPHAFRLWPQTVGGWALVLATSPAHVLGLVLSADLTRLVPRWQERTDALQLLALARGRFLRLKADLLHRGQTEAAKRIDDELARIDEASEKCERFRIASDAQVAMEIVRAEAQRSEDSYAEMEAMFDGPSGARPPAVARVQYSVKPPDPPRRR